LKTFYCYAFVLVQTLIDFSRTSLSNLWLNVNRAFIRKVKDGYFLEDKMAYSDFNVNELIMFGVPHNLNSHLFVEGPSWIVAN
jgi:hypothetical protein